MLNNVFHCISFSVAINNEAICYKQAGTEHETWIATSELSEEQTTKDVGVTADPFGWRNCPGIA